MIKSAICCMYIHIYIYKICCNFIAVWSWSVSLVWYSEYIINSPSFDLFMNALCFILQVKVALVPSIHFAQDMCNFFNMKL
jgi:hypothetical protein